MELSIEDLRREVVVSALEIQDPSRVSDETVAQWLADNNKGLKELYAAAATALFWIIRNPHANHCVAWNEFNTALREQHAAARATMDQSPRLKELVNQGGIARTHKAAAGVYRLIRELTDI